MDTISFIATLSLGFIIGFIDKIALENKDDKRFYKAMGDLSEKYLTQTASFNEKILKDLFAKAQFIDPETKEEKEAKLNQLFK